MLNAASVARPKRAAEDFARSSQSTSKKPRFDARNPSTLAADAPELDLVLDADVIGKSGPQIKRNAVNIDGYASDSDDDNFDTRAAERESNNPDGAPQSIEEEKDDMFAEPEESTLGDIDIADESQGRQNGKNVRFLEAQEIEGQIMSSKSGGRVFADFDESENLRRKRRGSADSNSSSSSSDEERDSLPKNMDEELAVEVGAGGKKKRAPRLDAFNLKDEVEEGKYDEAGNFVRRAVDPDAINDNWLEGVSKKDIRRAKEAQGKRQEEQRRKAAEDDAILTSDLISILLSYLEPSENLLEALQRMNKSRSTSARMLKWKRNKVKGKVFDDKIMSDATNFSDADEAELKRKHDVEVITGAADALYTRDYPDIYEMQRELLLRGYKRETGDDWAPIQKRETQMETDEDDIMYEYRWSQTSKGDEVHGPFDAVTMKSWNDAGYFSHGVEFRQVGRSEWSRILDVGS